MIRDTRPGFAKHPRTMNKHLSLAGLALALAPLTLRAADACCPDGGMFDKPAAGHAHAHGEGGNPRVVVTPEQVANLGLKIERIDSAKIARTAFALGDIVADPRGESAVASRIAGRVVELRVALGDRVKKGDTLAVLEARQPGGDPARVPVLALADGTVTAALTRLGEPVSPDTPLLRLADLTRLVAEVRIPQRFAADLAPGKTRLRMTPEGAAEREVLLDAFTPEADPVSGTLRGRVFLDNRDGSLSPGRRAGFRIVLSEKEYPQTVARGAVQGERGDLFVFVQETPGIYEKHPVVVIDGDENRVALSGPDAGELAVIHGGDSLRYADNGNLPLKAALDLAHGHAHGPNGEEPGAAKSDDHAGHDHKEGDGHDHESGSGHDHDEDAGHDRGAPEKPAAAPAPKSSGGKTALQAAMDAAHGHAHGPKGEEIAKGVGASSPGFFSGDSGAVFFGALAAGEAVLLSLALIALRRKQSKEASDA